MNWIKENKFLFGFLVVMVIGVGVGGWFLLGKKTAYDEAVANYEQRVAELNRLQRLPIFPNQKNLDQIVAQQTQVNTEVSALASTLMAQQIPVEELSPEKFQDELKKAVTAVKAKASQSSPAVKLPEPKFFLGFDPYETAPPGKDAASALGRQLKAIEWLCNQAIENKVAEIKSLERDPLPEEKGRVRAQVAKSAPPAKAAPGKKPGPEVKAGARFEVEKHGLKLVFAADQARFRQFLNAIVGYQGQFFIPRLVNVKNENPKAPPRVAAAPDVPPPAPDPNAPPAGTPASPTAPAAPATPAVASSYIVGEEKVEVTLVLEMVEFSEAGPATAAAPK